MTHSVILIGGAGFVGCNIRDALASDPRFCDLNPALVDDMSGANPDHDAAAIPHYHGPYQDAGARDFVAGLGTGPRSFVFLAGETRVKESSQRPLDFIRANVQEPAAFVQDVLRAGDHFILFSTAGALFDGQSAIGLDTPYSPKNVYGATKAAEEMLLSQLVALRGARMTVLRPTNIYGPHSRRKKSAVHAFIRAALAGDSVTLNGDGRQSRDFIYAGDVGRVVADVVDQVRRGGDPDPVHLLGSGASISLCDVVAGIGAVSGQPLAHDFTPARDLLATEPRDVIVAPDQISPLLQGRITPFQTGLAQTYAHYAADLAAPKDIPS